MSVESTPFGFDVETARQDRRRRKQAACGAALVPERILKENIALAERGAKTAADDGEASGLARSSQARGG